MRTDSNEIIKSYSVPGDMLMDILRIIVKNRLRFKIEGINERQNTLLMKVYFPPNSNFTRDAIENIQGYLSDYGYYMNAGPNMDWDDGLDEDNLSSDYLLP